ncbi:threonine/serine dehydratase, partial [Xanthomonas oryzae pv. oryzae]
NFALLQHAGAQVITVDDAAVVQAMRLIWQLLKQVVEPSSVITLAAVLAEPARFAGRRVGLILSGGNVDLDALPWAAA